MSWPTWGVWRALALTSWMAVAGAFYYLESCEPLKAAGWLLGNVFTNAVAATLIVTFDIVRARREKARAR